MDKFRCPRRGPWSPSPLKFDAEELGDHWLDDHTCSYCGSLKGEDLLARIRAGDILLGPTDKNYKVYVKNEGGQTFKQSYRNCGSECAGPESCTHWVTRDMEQTKFYFHHLNEEQQDEFISLYNSKVMKLDYPGYFYNLPFFCRRLTSAE
jgi:hypothetical protein